jgi:flavodoxin
MLSVKLPKTLEKQLREVVQKNYQGDLQVAIVAFLRLQKKYGWKEQFLKDIEAIRDEVRRRGGIKAKTINAAVKKYRKSIGASRE